MTFCWGDDPVHEVTVPALTVDVTEPCVVAQLLGPDGAVLLEITDRGWVPFGFQPPEAAT